MNKYIITFKEYDEEGYSQIRAIFMDGNTPEEAGDNFWRLYTDGDVRLLSIKKA